MIVKADGWFAALYVTDLGGVVVPVALYLAGEDAPPAAVGGPVGGVQLDGYCRLAAGARPHRAHLQVHVVARVVAAQVAAVTSQ